MEEVQCNFCSFESQNPLMTRIHNYKHNFCVPCNLLSNSLEDFLKHLEVIHGIKHQCKICEENFLLEISLTEHLRSSHCTKTENILEKSPTTKETISYTCDICKKNFRYKFSLQKHIKRNHEEEIQNPQNFSPNNDSTENVINTLEMDVTYDDQNKYVEIPEENNLFSQTKNENSLSNNDNVHLEVFEEDQQYLKDTANPEENNSSSKTENENSLANNDNLQLEVSKEVHKNYEPSISIKVDRKNCFHCQFKAKKFEDLKAHALNDHLQCLDCGLKCDNREATLDHLEFIHSKKWECNICNTRYFTSKFALQYGF